MSWYRWTLAALAVLAVGVGTRAARADDVIRLGLNQGAPTVTLDLNADKEAETQAAFWHGGGYYRGYGSFYRPSYYGGFGYSSYYRPSYYGGFGYSSYYRPSYYYGGGFGYSSYYYRPSYYYGGYSSYYYQPSYYYGGYSTYYSPYYCPISMNVDVSSSAAVPGGTYVPPLPRMDPLPQTTTPMQPLPQGKPSDGTYQYDGGPSNPVPLPQDGAQPQKNPNKGFVPGEGRLVSLPLGSPTPKYSYPAYGDNKK